MKDIKISIAMCTYNSEKTLIKAIASVVNQRYQNWELIIIDNASVDGTKEILSHIKDDRIIIRFNESNIGWAHGMSECIKSCTGDYITFLAADDMLSNEEALEAVANTVKEDEPDMLFVGNYYAVYSDEEDGLIINKQTLPERRAFDGDDKLYELDWLMTNTYYNSLFHYERVEFLKENNIDFFAPFYSDCAGMTEGICRAKKISVIDKPIYILTINTSQTRGTASVIDVERTQWNSVLSILNEVEELKDPKVARIATRIIKNSYNRLMCISNPECDIRDADMNKIEANEEMRLALVQEAMDSDEFLQMQAIVQIDNK